MRRDTYICDNCGVAKGETNHWWTALDRGSSLTLTPFNSRRDDVEIHLCGVACSTIFANKWMAQHG